MLLAFWSGVPATEVQWLDILLTFVGFPLAVLGVLTVPHMIWGRSRLITEYQTVADGEDRSLIVFLQNPPVERRILKRIGVHRDAIQSLAVKFRIAEAGSGTILDPMRDACLRSDDGTPDDDRGSYRIVLPPTFSAGASFTIALWNKDTSRADIPPDRLRPAIGLADGLYRAEIIYTIDGENWGEYCEFKVGHKGDDLMWVKNEIKRVSLDR